MPERCFYIEGCPIYKHFLSQNVKEVFVTAYCEGRFEDCARKQLRDKGEPVPELLLPTGKFLKKY